MTRLRGFGSLALLGLVPAAAAVHLLAPDRHVLVFVVAALAILPLAGQIGSATETLARRLGGAIGGLLNATFGNAAELIIGALALHRGLPDLVKASITGSILGNLLLVFGAAAVAGGLREPIQRFNRTAASTGTTMLLLSAVALSVPATFQRLARTAGPQVQLELDLEISIVLLVAYACYLLFTLRTHRAILGAGPAATDAAAAATRGPTEMGSNHASGDASDGPSVRSAVVTLLAATAGAAYVSELLVDSVSAAATTLGFSHLFVGVVIVALVGNAAEHYSAITLARSNQMDGALAIAVGSSTQVALFVAPVLVLLSYAIAPQPLDLLFTTFEVAAVVMAVLVIAFIAHDGETHWMEGVMLLAVYTILVLGFYFLPAPAVSH